MSEQRKDVYTRITSEIIAAIERGAGPFNMPWHHDGSSVSRPINLASQKPYRGINVVALWAAADRSGYSKGLWGTYRQWQAQNAQVRKGVCGSTVVLWKQSFSTDDQADNTDDDAKPQRPFFAQAFTVFNVEQVDGYTTPTRPQLDSTERLEQADKFINNLNINCVFGGDGASYNIRTDTVHMPSFAQFKSAEAYAATYIHECGHASGASHRLNRDLSGSFGSERYAAEEICAELLSSFILADLGIANEPRPDHAAYIESWLKKLRTDPRAIFTAASKAQIAADWMHACQVPADATALSA
jgi:antirestriction protein ArdC